MEPVYNRIICNVKRPSPKAIFISLPMYMFRLKTRKFEYGIDFFQKAVLMFKTRGIDNSTIAACLGLEKDLIDEVAGVLAYSGYLYPDGRITPHGLEMRDKLDTIVVDNNKEELGYIFQYVDRNEYYPYYIKNLGEEPNLTSNNEIIVGTKGDGRDRALKPYSLESSVTIKNLPFPDERVILDLICKSGKEGIFPEKLSKVELGRELSLSFVPETPAAILIQVCTYIYLPQNEDETYEADWQVLDPFGHGNNDNLKTYLKKLDDKDFKKEIDKKFRDAKTINGKKFEEYEKLVEEQVERIKEEDFGIEFEKLDANLQQYLLSVIISRFNLKQYNYQNFNFGDQFIINCQRALEVVFKIDSEKRSAFYNQMKIDFTTPANGDRKSYGKKRNRALKELFDNGIFRMNQPMKLINMARKVEPDRANSLKQYIYRWVLTYNYDNKSLLFTLLHDKLDTLFSIADLRNKSGHGQTEASGKVSMIPESTVENCYSFLREFINTYMTITL